jgi:hypothetical protein
MKDDNWKKIMHKNADKIELYHGYSVENRYASLVCYNNEMKEYKSIIKRGKINNIHFMNFLKTELSDEKRGGTNIEQE